MRKYYNGPTVFEKLLSVATYLTGGLVGIIWVIFCHLTKNYPKPFVKFHAYQSIILSIIFWLFSQILSIILAFIKIIPFIGTLVVNIYYFIFEWPLILSYSLFQFGLVLLMIYLCIGALMGKFSEIPVLSDNVKKMI